MKELLLELGRIIHSLAEDASVNGNLIDRRAKAEEGYRLIAAQIGTPLAHQSPAEIKTAEMLDRMKGSDEE